MVIISEQVSSRIIGREYKEIIARKRELLKTITNNDKYISMSST